MKPRDAVAGLNPHVVAAKAGAGQTTLRCGDDLVTIACHENRVPAFVESDIATLYGSLYASIPLLQTYDSLRGDVHTIVMRRNDRLDAIFLARIHGAVLSVINEGVRVSGQQVELFCSYIFSRYKQVSVIEFSSIETGTGEIPFAHQCYRCLENIVIELPQSVEAYHARLGKNTRRNLRRYRERLLHDFPGFSWEVVDAAHVNDDDVRAIIRLNIERMASKHKTSAYDDEETERLVGLARRCGLVGIARIDGKVCGGALAYRTGDNTALSVLAHDRVYNDYSLGLLCAYQIICDCIGRGVREFHFLWGRYDYKFLLLARERPLYKLTVYRSRAQMLLHAGVFARNQFEDGKRRLSDWLHEAGRRESALARLALRLLMIARSARRVVSDCPFWRV